MRRTWLLCAAWLAACGGRSDEVGSAQADGIELLSKLPGLWTGAATDTLLGDFPLTNMDFRASSDSVLFGRVDLDAENALRFSFSIEAHGGKPTLIFRNGGLFQGLSRDTRMTLKEHHADSYRFCALERGCEYADATFVFSSATTMTLTVLVRGQPHETWRATRAEERSLPASFPVHTDLSSTADFPSMPSATFNVSWTQPLAHEAPVWLILSKTNCVPAGACSFSRAIETRAPSGATSADITLDQVHADTYYALAVVDVDANLAIAHAPSAGDLLTVPSPTISIGAGVNNASLVASFTLP